MSKNCRGTHAPNPSLYFLLDHLGEKHLQPYFGSRRLCDLERGGFKTSFRLKEPEKYSAQTFWHFRSTLSKVFWSGDFRDRGINSMKG